MLAQDSAPPPPPPVAAVPAVPAVAPRAAAHTRAVIAHGGSGGGYLGVSVRDLSHDEAGALKLPDDSGVEVTVVDTDSPAGKAGLKEHDIIRAFNGEKVESRNQLARLLSETPSGHTVALDVMRNGQSMNLKVQLADRHTYAQTWTMPRVEIPEINIPAMNIDMSAMEMVMNVARSGVQVEPLTPQLREFFGAPAEQGLLVRSVEKGGPAEQAGLRAGDVIVKVGDRPIRNLGDYRMALRDANGKSVTLGIVRDKREQGLTMKMPDRRESSSAMRDFDFDFYSDFDPEQFASLASSADAIRAELQAQFQSGQWKEWQKQFSKAQKDLEHQMKELQKQWKDDIQ
ncbi:MAG TPA: PDZ domain-containing protein [Terriglobales bacterium]|nr:PDZ domain-containing protein [Terriglobales bacterium]